MELNSLSHLYQFYPRVPVGDVKSLCTIDFKEN
jgi:hypothetical protein